MQLWYTFLWWLIPSLIGWLAFPLWARFARPLPDWGHSLSRAFGLLASAYIFWLLSSLGFLNLGQGGAIFALLVLSFLSLWAGYSHWSELRDWLRREWRAILLGECVFLVGFLFMAYIRALNPEIAGTEKPMEFAFLNSILRSGAMPAPDPWLSGYAISYYYFGYVIMAMITSLSSVPSALAFNLALALIFGLASLGVYGLVRNLILLALGHEAKKKAGQTPPRTFAGLFALLAPVFLLVTGNWNGLLEVLFQNGFFTEGFWKWTKILPFVENTFQKGTGAPSRYYWWWASSRVVRDIDIHWKMTGNEVIDEFPFFSFLLGDMHPHVLNLPFTLLAIGFALLVFLNARQWCEQNLPVLEASSWHTRAQRLLASLPLQWEWLLLGGLILGGLSFLNTWDYPIYLFLTALALFLGASQRQGWSPNTFAQAALAFFAWLVCGIMLYFPFYVGFKSQAGGILPNPVYSTTLLHFFVMFGVLLMPILVFIVGLVLQNRKSLNWRAGLLSGPALWAFLLVFASLLAFAISQKFPDLAASALGGMSFGQALPALFLRRWGGLHGLTLVVVPLLFALGALVLPPAQKEPAREKELSILPFIFAMLATGALLVLGPDYVYLKDGFGSRMNTIFKFYYQAWILWAVAAAFASWYIIYAMRGLLRIFGAYLVVIGLFFGLVYPFFALLTKTENFQGTTNVEGKRIMTLDGLAFVRNYEPDEMAAVDWLNANIPGRPVVAEAIGGSYSGFARISARTGLPTVLGWPWHEVQWRGSAELQGTRETDVATLYNTPDWLTAKEILQRYDVSLVVVGAREKEAYQEGEFNKFSENMQILFDSPTIQIYGWGE